MTTLQEARQTFQRNQEWWKDGETATELERLYIAGETYLDLAKRFNTNPNDIYERVKGLGLIKKHGRGSGGSHFRKKQKKLCNCLRCGKPFNSEGIHNRMCIPCKREG